MGSTEQLGEELSDTSLVSRIAAGDELRVRAVLRPPQSACVCPGHVAVIGVLNGLPAVQRKVLELAYFGGLAVREIAVETHDTEAQVAAHLRLAMDALRRVQTTISATLPDAAITHA